MKKNRILLMMLVITTLFTSACQTSAATSPLGVSPAFSSTDEQVEYASFFDSATIHQVSVTIDTLDYQAILADPEAEEFYPATITLDGVEVDDVGFRTKGNSTLRSVANSTSDRYSFKINASEYVDKQKVAGLDEFVLNNMYADASYLREYLSYELMSSLGMDVPMASFVNVSINNEHVGFYLLVESVDDSFIKRVFGDNDGNLYRQDQGSSLAVDETETYPSSSQKNGDDQTKADLHLLTTTLQAIESGDKGAIEDVLDVESALYYMATNFMLSNYDSYNSRMQQNYYLYNHQGVFYVIPWDFNMSFGGFPEQVNGELNVDMPISGTNLSDFPLIEKLLSIEEYKTRYYEILKEYAQELEGIEEHITELADWIRPYVKEDPTKFTTIEDFEAAIIYQENEVVQVRPQGNREPKNRDTPPTPPQDGQAPMDNQPGLSGKGPNQPRGDMSMGSGRSLINVIRETIDAVKEQVVN
ncbi:MULTISPECIES: CotH kinase family protein [unclassified Fusibacter]|uniref:CotH kinase family protein n=1 Tax=unclassified Fusibacter TaxID=2624464 RepID=UPI001011770B|nr:MULTISPECIES: CotH kinase family protein [unclassified Fusibacter]MCK8060203.1 CotH kinase family protein [Fusibacter sp. A2]NPE22343.1 CotH kinase family protein [Fusibacter sp. A1]RXV61116.1 spore coat protein CotH [Fusibacter sp. A1]